MGEQRSGVVQRLYWPFLWGGVFLVLLALGGMTWRLWQASRPHLGGESPLEHLGNFGLVPEFVLIERSGQQVTRNDLLGLVWVANVFYTRCPDTCPLQSAELVRLQHDFADDRDVRLVSISVDPEHDTSAVLQDYAQRFGAAPARWLFLTGDTAAIYHLAQQGFHLSVAGPGSASPRAPEAPPLEGRSGAHRSELQSGSQDMHRTLPLPSLVTLVGWVIVPHTALAHEEVEHTPVLHSSRFVLVDRQARIRGYYHSDEAAALRRLRQDVRTVLQES
jgi:cytochrome oxidase Cu insertion factor (SCO1/SenC/PrrC family)